LTAVAGTRQDSTAGRIEGSARDELRNAQANAIVRARNIDTGQLAATGTTTAEGAFVLIGLSAGNFVVELVDAAGNIICTSTPVSLTSTAMIATGVTLSCSRNPAAALADNEHGFFTRTAGIVTLAAIGAGITIGVVAYRGRCHDNPGNPNNPGHCEGHPASASR
jgi:hypothetical protein